MKIIVSNPMRKFINECGVGVRVRRHIFLSVKEFSSLFSNLGDIRVRIKLLGILVDAQKFVNVIPRDDTMDSNPQV